MTFDGQLFETDVASDTVLKVNDRKSCSEFGQVPNDRLSIGFFCRLATSLLRHPLAE